MEALPFSSAWPFADTQTLYPFLVLESHSSAPEERALYEKLTLSVGQHIFHVAHTQGLEMPPHSEEADTYWLQAWRAAAQAPSSLEANQLMTLGNPFFNALHRVLWKANSPAEGESIPTPEALHEELVKLIETGTFHYRDLEHGECFNSGLHLKLWTKNWKPGLLVRRIDPYSLAHLAEGDITPPQLHHLTIPVPSGKLLAFNWCHIGAFTRLTEEATKDARLMGSIAGRVRYTEAMATLGIACVYVADGSTDLYVDGNGLRAGAFYQESEEPSGTRLGSVCNDLWWTCVMDRQVLVEMLSKADPGLDVEAAMAQWKASHSGFMEFDGTVGEHHLYFSGQPDVFEKHFSTEEVSMEGFDESYFVLASRPLTPVPKRSKAPKP